MSDLLFQGKKIELDENGFMVDHTVWDESVAEMMAKREGIEQLSKQQRDIIQFMRSYYLKYENFPILGKVCKTTKQRGKCVDQQFINPEKAWKIAGLPKMDGVHFVSHDNGEHYHMEDYC